MVAAFWSLLYVYGAISPLTKSRPLREKLGVNHAFGSPSLADSVWPPCRWVTIGTPYCCQFVVPISAHSIDSSMGNKWGNGCWLLSTRLFFQKTCSGTSFCASMVGPGYVPL